MAFNHIDYIAWNKRKVSIDGFLSALNVGKYATSAISINYLNQLEQKIKNSFRGVKDSICPKQTN